MRSESGEVHRQFRRCSLFCLALAGFSLLASRRWDCRCNIICLQSSEQEGRAYILAGPLRREQSIFDSRGFGVSKRQRRSGVWQRTGKFGLDRFKRRLQAIVDSHEFKTLNLFSGQCEGREMKGIEGSQ